MFPLSSTTTVAPGFTSFTFAAIAAFSSSVNLAGSFTNVLSAGLAMSFPAFGFAASASVLTKSFPGITAVFPSGVVTVAFPLSSTTTVESGFTSFTFAAIAFFSASVNFSGLTTTVLSAGLTMSFPAFGLATSSCDLTRSFPGITAVFPSGVVTVAFPLSSTTTVAPGFTALTLSSIAFFSASVNFSGFAATVLSAGLTMSFPAFGFAASSGVLTRSVAGITAVFPSDVVTVAFPLSSTTTVASGFTSFTFAAIAAFSSSVNLAGSFTTVLSAGFTTSFPAFGFSASSGVLTRSVARITAVFPSGVVTNVFPLSSITTVAPGFTALTLSSIAFFSGSVNCSGFAATVLSAGFTTSFPAFGLVSSVSDLNKSSDGIVAVVPSFRVTVTSPFSSNLTDLVSGFSSLNFSSALA